jgi:hypothetical protein
LLVIENRSKDTLTTLRITSANPTQKHTQTIEGVRDGTDVTPTLPIKQGDHLTVEGTLEGGRFVRWSGVAGEPLRLVILPTGDIRPRPGGKPSP